ncbi:hypothetical protein G9A89_000764, partial [Geosiphon pyriformis]
QQLQQQPQQQMAYTSIVKLEKFMGKKDNTQQSWLTIKTMPEPYRPFYTFCKILLIYDIKQRETEAVTTYLGSPQILNQFIRELYSSIFQYIHPMHSQMLQDAVTNARDFESAKLEANYAQTINLVMNKSSELDSKLKQFKPLSSNNIKPLSTPLPTNATANLLTINLSASSTCNLSAAATIYLSTTATNNILTSNSHNKLTIRIMPVEFKNWNYLSLLVIPENATSNNIETNQTQTLTSNISPATVTNNKSLAAIFSFKLEELSSTFLFSGAVLKEKPITTMYTNAKVDGHSIKFILDNDTKIIMANRVTKTPIGKIDNLPIEVNGIIVPIKILIMKATQYQALPEQSTHTFSWANEDHNELPPILDWEEKDKGKEKKKEKDISEKTNDNMETSSWRSSYSMNTRPEPPYIFLRHKLIIATNHATLNAMVILKNKASETTNHVLLVVNNYWMKEYGITFLDKEKYVILYVIISHLDGYPHDENEIWQMANAKVKDTSPKEILEIKNNPFEPINVVLISNSNAFLNIETDPKEFHEHYQNLAPTREEQKQCLEEINT